MGRIGRKEGAKKKGADSDLKGSYPKKDEGGGQHRGMVDSNSRENLFLGGKGNINLEGEEKARVLYSYPLRDRRKIPISPH